MRVYKSWRAEKKAREMTGSAWFAYQRKHEVGARHES